MQDPLEHGAIVREQVSRGPGRPSGSRGGGLLPLHPRGGLCPRGLAKVRLLQDHQAPEAGGRGGADSQHLHHQLPLLG